MASRKVEILLNRWRGRRSSSREYPTLLLQHIIAPGDLDGLCEVARAFKGCGDPDFHSHPQTLDFRIAVWGKADVIIFVVGYVLYPQHATVYIEKSDFAGKGKGSAGSGQDINFP